MYWNIKVQRKVFQASLHFWVARYSFPFSATAREFYQLRSLQIGSSSWEGIKQRIASPPRLQLSTTNRRVTRSVTQAWREEGYEEIPQIQVDSDENFETRLRELTSSPSSGPTSSETNIVTDLVNDLLQEGETRQGNDSTTNMEGQSSEQMEVTHPQRSLFMELNPNTPGGITNHSTTGTESGHVFRLEGRPKKLYSGGRGLRRFEEDLLRCLLRPPG